MLKGVKIVNVYNTDIQHIFRRTRNREINSIIVRLY
jgi:hypothetical protein